MQARQNHFAESESPYQVPASAEEDIYEQLKRQHIIRIPPDNIM